MSFDDNKEHSSPRQKPERPKFLSHIWDTFDTPRSERRLLTKLDAALISFGAIGKVINELTLAVNIAADKYQNLGYFIKSVDGYNINNAFVSGMYVNAIVTIRIQPRLTIILL